MYHIYFIHSSVDGHFVCFHGLAIVIAGGNVNQCSHCEEQYGVSLKN